MSGAAADDAPRISGPVVHDNLAVYFIHGPSAPGPVPLTLKEALERGKVIVHETGSVNTLSIENSGSDEVCGIRRKADSESEASRTAVR